MGDEQPVRVVIVGAGIIGLSVALALCESGGRYEILVLSDRRRDQTTSSVAAAFWYPFAVNGYYQESWAWATYLRLLKLLEAKGNSPLRKLGKHVVSRRFLEYHCSATDRDEVLDARGQQWWLRGLTSFFDFRQMNDDFQVQLHRPELRSWRRLRGNERVPSFSIRHRIEATLPVLDAESYLKTLESELISKYGVKFAMSKSSNNLPVPGQEIPFRDDDEVGLDGESEREERKFRVDYVVNCAGVCGGILANETETGPDTRGYGGSIIRLPVPDGCEVLQDFPTAVFAHTGPFRNHPVYVVPRSHDVILGGSIEPPIRPERRSRERHKPPCGRDTNPDEAVVDAIIKRCRSFESSGQLQPGKIDQYLDFGRAQVEQSRRNFRGFRPVRGRQSQNDRRPSGSFRDWKEGGVRLGANGQTVHCYGHGGAGITLSWGCALRVCELIQGKRHPDLVDAEVQVRNAMTSIGRDDWRGDA